MKKITILALHLGYGGVEKSISSLSNILVDKYDVEIISVYKLYDEPAFYIDNRVKITYLLDKNLSPNKKEFRQAIKDKKVYSVLKEGLKSAKIIKLKKSKMIEAVKAIEEGIVISTRIEHNEILSKYGNEKLITIAQEHTHHNSNKEYINRLVKSCENINYFMPVSQTLTDFYSEYFKDKKSKCIFIPHSLDYIPNESSKLTSNNIISVGRLSPEKGYLDLIDVFKLVNKSNPELVLNIIGDGEERKLLINKIKDNSLENKVILHGYKNKEYINDLLKQSSIYVMASHEESFGIVLIEAQSFGIPCIAFDSAQGACEIIKDDINGYLISNRSKEQFAKKIIDLMENNQIRQRMGDESRKNAYNYSKENISEKWIEFLENISCK